MKPKCTIVFLQVAKNVGVTRGKIWTVRMMLKCFPAKSVAYPSLNWQYGDGRYHAKGWFRPRAFQGVLTLSGVSTPGQQEENQTSLLFLVCLHFQCRTSTLYTTLTSRAIKKQLCGLVHFHYACLLPYRWQYRFVMTVLPAFARNVFYGVCSVFPSYLITFLTHRTISVNELF